MTIMTFLILRSKIGGRHLCNHASIQCENQAEGHVRAGCLKKIQNPKHKTTFGFCALTFGFPTRSG
jgi:hypothetical protein